MRPSTCESSSVLLIRCYADVLFSCFALFLINLLYYILYSNKYVVDLIYQTR